MGDEDEEQAEDAPEEERFVGIVEDDTPALEQVAEATAKATKRAREAGATAIDAKRIARDAEKIARTEGQEALKLSDQAVKTANASQEVAQKALELAEDDDQPDLGIGIEYIGDVGTFYGAFVQAQTQFDTPKKTGEVEFRTDDGRKVEYDYAPLEEILDATVPALNEAGMGFHQPFSTKSGGGWMLRSILAHETGAMMVVTVEVPAKSKLENMAGAVTKLRRYVASSMLGVADSEDDDTMRIDTGEEEQTPKKTPRSEDSSEPSEEIDGDPPEMSQKALIGKLRQECKRAGIPEDATSLPSGSEFDTNPMKDTPRTFEEAKAFISYLEDLKEQGTFGNGD